MLRVTRPVYRSMVNRGILRAYKLTAKTWVHDQAELDEDLDRLKGKEQDGAA